MLARGHRGILTLPLHFMRGHCWGRSILMKPNKKVPLPQNAITKASGLLPMMYSISEVCLELDIPRHIVRSWLQRGLPHQRDERKRIWINGKECLSWIEMRRIKQKRKKTLEENQAHCFRCHENITIMSPQVVTEHGNRRITGLCPDCGGPVNRGVINDQPQHQSQDNGR